jgi:phenylalanyl-tRNA synthetase alpha chain
LPGRCFRNENIDAGHENTFFQLEGVIVDKEVSVGNLIYFMKEMLSKIFKKEVDVRLRPGFFPFTEYISPDLMGFESHIRRILHSAQRCLYTG